jgi:hypothetical protein
MTSLADAVCKSQALNQKKLEEFLSQQDGMGEEEDTEHAHKTRDTSIDILKQPQPQPSNAPPIIAPNNKQPLNASVSSSSVVGTSAPAFPLLAGASGLGAFDAAADLFAGVNDINMSSTEFLGAFNTSAHPASLKPAIGGLMHGLMTQPWMDYADAAQNSVANFEQVTMYEPAFPTSNAALEYTLPPYNTPLTIEGPERNHEAVDVAAPVNPQSEEGFGVVPEASEDADVDKEMGDGRGAKKRGGKKRKSRAMASSKGKEPDAVEGSGGGEGRETKRTRRVNTRLEMPDWMCQAKHYLIKGLDRTDWAGCLEKWWLWEEQSAALASPTARLGAGSYRPAEVSKWLQRKDFVHIPEIEDLEAYGCAWLEWWDKLKEVGEAGMKKPGMSGLVMVVVLLKWWEPLAKDGDERWTRAVEELDKMFATWVS